jgi:hypothetical protein
MLMEESQMAHLWALQSVGRQPLNTIMNSRRRRSKVPGRLLLFQALDMFILTNHSNEGSDGLKSRLMT